MSLPRIILAATDFSKSAVRAVDAAVVLAEKLQAELHLIHALEVPIPIFEPYAVTVPAKVLEAARDAAQAELESAFSAATARGVAGAAHLGQVPAADAIAEKAQEIGADLVVIGTRGQGAVARFFLGSVASHTIRQAPCSVLTVEGAGDPGAPGTILVGVDFSEASHRAFQEAADFAGALGASLHVMHAVDLQLPFVSAGGIAVPGDVVDQAVTSAREKLDAWARELPDTLSVILSVETGHASEVIEAAASDVGADWVVAGSEGRSALSRRVLGSTTERLLHHAPCSVLVSRRGDPRD